MADKSFDDLFEEFFGDGKKKESPIDKFIGNVDGTPSLGDEIKRIVKLIDKIKGLSNPEFIDESMGSQIANDLGAPDEVQVMEEDGIYYTKNIWNLPHSQLVRVLVSNRKPDGFNNKTKASNKPVLSLEEQLDAALEEEAYLEAARLRDLIKANKKNKK
jgi:hypothetical protein